MHASPRKRPASKPATSGCSRPFWFLAGASVGALACGLVLLRVDKSFLAEPPQVEAPSAAPAKAQKPQTHFDFYSLLPEMEVVIPDSGGKRAENEKKPAADSAPDDAGSGARYLLQIGSFRRQEDAEKRRAELAFLGVETEVQKITINNRDTYHRVLTHSFADQSAMDRTRKLLEQNQINTMVIRLKER
jgi:cell division protein FtsN